MIAVKSNRKESGQNLRNSRQRTRMIEILQATDTHPTADKIYEKLKKEFPKLSLGTVYRNLSVLVDQGLVRKIHFGSTFDRFEANMNQHYHLICEKCKSIIDFTMPIYDDLNKKAAQLTSFSVKRHIIEFYGICQGCSKSRKN